MNLLIATLLTLLFRNSSVTGYPNGAGGCDTGGAVGGVHLTNTPLTTGSLATGSYQVMLDNSMPLAARETTTIAPLNSYTFSIVPPINATFTGALIRIEGKGAFTLTPGINAQVASVCYAPVAGVTHSEFSDKTEFTAIFESGEVSDYLVDVTVVVYNAADEGSEYYYTQYQLKTADNSTTPITTPAATPSGYVENEAVASPATSPVKEPTALAPTSSTSSNTPIAATTLLVTFMLIVALSV
jgi:hypothetical protein